MTVTRCLAIGWFVFCLAMTLALIFSDHWILYAVAWTPLPSLLLPTSLVLLTFLLFVRPRFVPWGIGAVMFSLLVTPYEVQYWGSDQQVGHIRGTTKKPEDTRDVTSPETELRIVNANLGQRDQASLLDFIEFHRPDIVATQAGFLRPETPWLEAFDHWEVGRLTLWSHWPITDGRSVIRGDHVHAARFEIAWPSPTSLVVYVVHFPTPRHMLGNLRGRGIFHAEHRRDAVEFQERKHQLLQELSRKLAAEEGPTLLVGDVNQPALGPAYRQLVHGLRDGHRAAGWGFGYTIPGSVHSNLLQKLCPWSRCDYVLANEKLRFREHRTDPPHPGQHRAIYARLEVASRVTTPHSALSSTTPRK